MCPHNFFIARIYISLYSGAGSGLKHPTVLSKPRTYVDLPVLWCRERIETNPLTGYGVQSGVSPCTLVQGAD